MKPRDFIRRPVLRLSVQTLLALLAIYFLPLGFFFVAAGLVRGFPQSNVIKLMALPELQSIRVVTVVIGSVLYGVIRARRTHPLLDSHYRNWLVTTPWRLGTPLPLGSALPAWEDVIFIGAVTLLICFDRPQWIWAPSLAASMTYSIAVALPALSAGRTTRAACYAMAMIAPTFLLVYTSPAPMAILTAGLLVSASVSVHQTLKWLPLQAAMQSRLDEKRGFRRADVWPLSPREPAAPLDRLDSVCITLLLSWITYCATSLYVVAMPVGDGVTLVLVACGCVGFSRLIAYALNFGAPINIWGRLSTGQFIIPGYDRIWIAPIAAVVTSLATFAVAIELRLPVGAASALSVAALLAVSLHAGPTLRNWQLTGHHRIVFRPQQQNPAVKRISF